MPLTIGPYQVDTETRRVLKSGQTVKWGEKASQLFVLLLENSPDTIAKDQIFDKVWQDRVVTENSLYKTISKLRQELQKEHIEIESVFGEGYRIVNAVKTEEVVLKSNKKWWFGLFFLAVFVLSWLIYQAHSHNKLLKDMKQLKQVLAVTKQAFISQIYRRNELGELLSKRFTLNKDDSWEKRFYTLYDQMNEQELFLCQQTRAFTEGPLYENNQAAFDLLQANSKIIEALPMAQDLVSHLSIWLNKYHRVFEDVDAMCLLYVGVEDGAKYPSEFDAKLDDWIKENQ